MSFKNTTTEYGAVTKTFHWTVALIVICLLAAGLTMDKISDLSLKLKTYNLHKSFGITILALTLCRVCWHIYSNRPNPVDTLQMWERYLSKALHIFLYILLLAMPLTGWLMSSAGGRPVHVFNLFTLPDLVNPDPVAAKIFRYRHGQIADLIMIALALHIGAVIKHTFIDKDIVFKRMLPFFVFLMMLVPTSSPAAETRIWRALHDQSSISFEAKQMGTVFKGSFSLFGDQIGFDPDHLENSKVVIDIPLSSVYTGAPDRDDNLKGKDWFDVTQFPTALFETKSFRKTGKDTYEADAVVTIRKISVPVTLPFTLHIVKTKDKTTATVDGSVTLDRSKFQLGTGQWADTSVIANEVPVTVHITAIDQGMGHF